MKGPDNPAERIEGTSHPIPPSRQEPPFGLARRLLKSERRRNFLILLAAAAIVFTVWMTRGLISDIEWRDLGYPGVFFLSFLGSVSMVLPVPGLITLCGVSVILNPFLVGLVAGVGESIGEVSGYAVGLGGKAVIENHSLYIRVRGWMERRGALVIFVVSLIPNPLVDVVGIAAGATHFPFRRFMAIVLVGKTLKGIMVAYTCYHGLKLLPWVS